MHPLMRAILAKELPRDRPAAGVDVHSRAADWFNTHGQLGTAVEHAATSGDWLRAARFVVRSLAIGDLLLSTSTGSQLTGHLSGMPDLDSPDVHLVRAALDGVKGELESARASLGQCLTDASTSEDWLIWPTPNACGCIFKGTCKPPCTIRRPASPVLSTWSSWGAARPGSRPPEHWPS
jgi:hypothetical protein